jgi:hypothetical protein
LSKKKKKRSTSIATAQHPTNSIIVVGEAVALHQGWVEGALESVEAALESVKADTYWLSREIIDT